MLLLLGRPGDTPLLLRPGLARGGEARWGEAARLLLLALGRYDEGLRRGG